MFAREGGGNGGGTLPSEKVILGLDAPPRIFAPNSTPTPLANIIGEMRAEKRSDADDAGARFCTAHDRPVLTGQQFPLMALTGETRMRTRRCG